MFAALFHKKETSDWNYTTMRIQIFQFVNFKTINNTWHTYRSSLYYPGQLKDYQGRKKNLIVLGSLHV